MDFRSPSAFCALATTVFASCAVALAHGYARQIATRASFFNTAALPSRRLRLEVVSLVPTRGHEATEIHGGLHFVRGRRQFLCGQRIDVDAVRRASVLTSPTLLLAFDDGGNRFVDAAIQLPSQSANVGGQRFRTGLGRRIEGQSDPLQIFRGEDMGKDAVCGDSTPQNRAQRANRRATRITVGQRASTGARRDAD